MFGVLRTNKTIKTMKTIKTITNSIIDFYPVTVPIIILATVVIYNLITIGCIEYVSSHI